jgi:hypothetical protein
MIIIVGGITYSCIPRVLLYCHSAVWLTMAHYTREFHGVDHATCNATCFPVIPCFCNKAAAAA